MLTKWNLLKEMGNWHVYNMQMYSRRSTCFERRQIEAIGNIRIMMLYSDREYCNMFFTFSQCDGNTQTVTEYITSYFSFYVFLENCASSRFRPLDKYHVLITKILVLQSLCFGIGTPCIYI